MSTSTTLKTMDVVIDQLLATAPCTPQQREALGLAPNELYYPMIEDLRKSSMLEEFSLDCSEAFVMGEWDVAVARRLIPAAIRDNASISKVTLRFMKCNNSILLRNDIFVALANRSCNLDALFMEVSANDLSESDGFQSYLESLTLGDSERTLGELHLACEEMTTPLCRLLFAQPHRGKIKHVVIDGVGFAREGAQQFASCVRERTHGDEVVDVSVIVNSGTWGQYDIEKHAVGAFFLPSQGHVRVRSLEMTVGAFCHLPILTYYLPASLYINELHFRLKSNEDKRYAREETFDTPEAMFFTGRALSRRGRRTRIRRQLVDAIRRNGSLRSVKVMKTPTFVSGNPSPKPFCFFTEEQDRLVRACMIRNKKLPQLLSAPCFKTETFGKQDTNENDRSDHGGGTADLIDMDGVLDGGTPHLGLFASLLVAAIEVTSLAPTNVMIGLLPVKEAVSSMTMAHENIGEPKRRGWEEDHTGVLLMTEFCCRRLSATRFANFNGGKWGYFCSILRHVLQLDCYSPIQCETKIESVRRMGQEYSDHSDAELFRLDRAFTKKFEARIHKRIIETLPPRPPPP